MKTDLSYLAPYLCESLTIDDEGVLGLPVTLTSYTKTSPERIAPVIEYIVGTAMPRIGQEEDRTILADLIEEYIVIVVDYQGAPSAQGLALDESIQRVRRRIMDERLTIKGRAILTEGDNWVLPAGCRIIRHVPYFDLREHAPIGTLDYIVKIWNEDFTEVRGDVPITFPDGTVKLVRDVHPTCVEECLNRDGTPIELKLHLDIVYPSRVREGVRCPVAVGAASRQSTTGNWIMRHSPNYFTAMLFSGYAVMLFEHAYIPMARRDHYGYFPDGPSYKNESCDRHHGLGFFTGILSSCAAIRLLRYLIRTREELSALDESSLGMFCISKTGYNYALAMSHPEKFYEKRFLAPHHGECKEGTVQPNLSYPDGTPIPSNVQAVYAVAGSGDYFAREDIAPVMTTVGTHDGNLAFYRSVLRHGIQYDRETFYYDVPQLGHSMAMGYDASRRLDMYGAVLDFMDTHLMKNHGECAYISPRDGDTIEADTPIVLHFTGKVTCEEVEKRVTITNAFGKRIPFFSTATYGGCTHTLHAVFPTATAVFVKVPAGLTFASGVKTTRPCEATYSTRVEHTAKRATAVTGSVLDGEREVTISFPKLWRNASAPLRLRFATLQDSAQRVGVYRKGERLGEIALGPRGLYDFELSGIDTWTEPLTLTLRAEREVGVREHLCIDFSKEENLSLLCARDGVSVHTEVRDGRHALVIERDLYNYDKTTGYSLRIPLKESEWDTSDFGRRFLIHASFMSPDAYAPHGVSISVNYNRDPLSRYVDEFDTHQRLVHTCDTPGEWVEVEIPFAIDNPDYLNADIDKRSVSIGHDLGTLYVGKILVDEITTPVTIADGKDGTFIPQLIEDGYEHG